MNMQSIMAQAQKMKKDIDKKQEEINSTIFEGKSEWVTLTMNGKREVKSLIINKSLVKDEEDMSMLEDMIIIAFNDALRKLDVETESKMGMYGQGLSGLM